MIKNYVGAKIQEKIYMQYLIGYSSFIDEEPFEPSLFVEFRKRLSIEQINAINEKILHMANQKTEAAITKQQDPPSSPPTVVEAAPISAGTTAEPALITHEGKLIVDATACPQDISYPTDLNLLNDSRMKAEELINFLFNPKLHEKKPRTYRQKARKDYLKTAQKKRKTRSEIRNALQNQLCYLKRDFKSIYKLQESYAIIPFAFHQYKYFLVRQTLYDQQAKMYQQKIHSVEHRIVCIHQPHVRPIVRGKTNANVEFGAKMQGCLMGGYAFLEDLSWEAFNEGTWLMKTVEQYKARLRY